MPEFNWSASTDEDNEDTITYTFEIYYSNNTLYNQTDTTNNFTTPTLPTGFDETYHWRVRANDSYNASSWSDNWTFQYANWTITFNLTDSVTGETLPLPQNDQISIICNPVLNTGLIGTNPYTATNVFPPGDYSCDFTADGYFSKTQNITADSDKTIQVPMSKSEGLTTEEHQWLEWLYNCWNSGTCMDLLSEINQTTNNIWDQFKRTNQSIVTTEDIISKDVNATSNLTINYSINVPIKEGYTINDVSGEIRLDYLPIRISYWFLEYPDNDSCYSQGNYSVALAEPYCQPLTVYTVGQINSTINFTVDLRPSLPSGNYTIVRSIEIDPEQVWINYGQEVIGVTEVLEANNKPSISLTNTGTFPGGITSASSEPTTIEATDTVTGSAIIDIPSLTSIISLIVSILAIGLLGYFYISFKKRY